MHRRRNRNSVEVTKVRVGDRVEGAVWAMMCWLESAGLRRGTGQVQAGPLFVETGCIRVVSEMRLVLDVPR